MANRRRDAAKEANWRKMLRRFSASGLNIREFCRRERIAEPAFYAWRRTIAERDDARTSPPAFVPVAVTKPLAITQAAAQESSIMLELAGGCVLRFSGPAAAEQLADLVVALQARCAR